MWFTYVKLCILKNAILESKANLFELLLLLHRKKIGTGQILFILGK